jgi:hypothetical protein
MKEVIRKLKFGPEGVVINCPADLEKEFLDLGYANSFDQNSKSN